jgi:hypothetical protein
LGEGKEKQKISWNIQKYSNSQPWNFQNELIPMNQNVDIFNQNK